jgi:alkylhydroperoxidase/carboxymuconolactone decarboxylase family protein YurZ
MYGRVLSDPRWINALETELLAIGTLAVLDVPAQLRGHIGGARNVGATDTQIDTVLEIANTILTQTK